MAEVKIDSLKPNSNKYKADQKEKMNPVVKANSVVSTKKPLSKKFAETFIKEDVRDVKQYLLMDVIIPGAKNMILDFLGMMFFGKQISNSFQRRGGYYDSQRTNYTDYSERYRSRNYERADYRRGDKYLSDDKIDYQNVILRNCEDAENVVEHLRGRIHDQGSASVADLFDLINVAGKYTDNNWGWTRENQIGIKRVSDGFLIDVAEAKYLNDWCIGE